MEHKRFMALKNAIEPARKQLQPFRDELLESLKSYTGPHYGQNSSMDKPINMLELSVESLLQQLSSRAPQVLCTTHKAELKSAATEMELALNLALKKMEFEKEHRLWILSAIFSVGILEVGLDVVETIEVDGEDIPITDVFCEAIMFDDFVFDTSAAKWDPRQVGFWGHRFKVPLEEAKKDPSYDKEARAALKGMERTQQESTESVSRADGNAGTADQFMEMCELWQIFVPSENELITFSCESDIPLKTVEWTGPKRGPYHLVGFNPVLNNIMPLPPVANWRDLDDLENKLYSKLGRQASRQKNIGVTDLQGAKDGQTVMNADDGQVICVGNPNAFQEAHLGGIDQNTLGFALNVRSMADFVMGNLSAQMGLGSSAQTLGQEQLIRQASSVRISSMQGVILSATECVLRDIAFYLHDHPTVEFNMTRDITGTDMQIPVKWPYRDNGYGEEEDVRKGDYEEYDISIQPYSMTEVSPGERAQMLRDIWARDILPAIQLGVQPDVYTYLSKLGKYLDLPELNEIVPMAQQSMDPREMLSGGGGNIPQPGKPGGRYVRENVSRGMTPEALNQQREMQMLSAGGES